MADEEIPSGKNVRDAQADGTAAAKSRERPTEESEQVFAVSAVWSGDGGGSGEVRLADGSLPVPIAGSRELGGSGGAANPEELLLSAVAACFINTWAIFLKKLGVSYAAPAIRVRGNLGKDPAGGFRMTGAVIQARVPASLLAGEKAKIEKTLALSEKYCIISKVARAAMPVSVEIESV